jgi:uncharacterized protein (DUF1501 family)
MNHYSRRRFLKHGLLSPLAMAAMPGLSLQAFSSRSFGLDSEYKAMVCILLAGGADSFNFIVPRSDTAYQAYKSRRSDLALSQSELLALDISHQGSLFGLHPAMPGIQSLFNNQNAAFISNIGPLVSPTTREAYDNSSVRLPLGLFSHADQILSWQTASPGDRSSSYGFGGKLGNLIAGSNSGTRLATNISLSGNNAFQTGSNINPYSINAGDGIRSIAGYDNSFLKTQFDQLISQDSAEILQKVYADKFKSAINTGQIFNDALSLAPELSTTFAEDNVSRALQRIAQLISVREHLGVNRQTFFITYGGWDHHDNTLTEMAEMLPALDNGLTQFMTALNELGVANDVTTFTISDFGRTLTSNGKGSDHGWGGNALIMGGAVQGGQIYGQYPDLDPDNPLDVGRGRFIPSTSVDALYAELARWMGVSDADIATILPNWQAFIGSSQGEGLVGLLG